MSKLLTMMQNNVDAMRRIAAVVGMPSTNPGAVADRVLADRDIAAAREAKLERVARAARRFMQGDEDGAELAQAFDALDDHDMLPIADMGSGPTCCPAEMAVTAGEEAQP